MFRTLRKARLRIGTQLWAELVAELGRRGEARREAGAFLLARADGDRTKVRRVVYFDDVDPHCLRGHIQINATAFTKLWDICQAEDLVVVGDAHTHGGRDVSQSSIDAENPMVARIGHIALILPNFATQPVHPSDVGVHEYQGTRGWTGWRGREASRRLVIRRWP